MSSLLIIVLFIYSFFICYEWQSSIKPHLMMFPAGQHPLFPYTLENRKNVLEELNITETEMENDVQSIAEWFRKQPHLSEAGIHPKMIDMFLIVNKGSVEKVKRKLDNFYRHRLNMPELVSDRIGLLNNGGIQQSLDSYIVASMPKLYNNSRILVTKSYDKNKFNVDNVLLFIAMLVDIRLVNDCMTGDIWVIDAEGWGLSDLWRMSPISLSKGHFVLEEGIGLRTFNIHIINCSAASIGQAALNILRQFLNAKIIERIKVHERIEDFYKYVPKEYLPKDYGGDLPPLEQFRVGMKTFMANEQTKEFLIDACKLVSDESKRPKTDYREEYLAGNFKKLNVD